MNLYNIDLLKQRMRKENNEAVERYKQLIKECFCCEALFNKTDACIPFTRSEDDQTIRLELNTTYGYIFFRCKYCGVLKYCPYCGEAIYYGGKLDEGK